MGSGEEITTEVFGDYTVSIQLVSPASGDERAMDDSNRWYGFVSIQLVSPASGDGKIADASVNKIPFPFN